MLYLWGTVTLLNVYFMGFHVKATTTSDGSHNETKVTVFRRGVCRDATTRERRPGRLARLISDTEAGCARGPSYLHHESWVPVLSQFHRERVGDHSPPSAAPDLAPRPFPWLLFGADRPKAVGPTSPARRVALRQEWTAANPLTRDFREAEANLLILLIELLIRLLRS